MIDSQIDLSSIYSSRSVVPFFSDPSSILGGVRLPPDTEIIKYTSSIVGPKIPGTTNRGRKKTISLDTPSVSVHLPVAVSALSAHQTNTTTSTSSLMMEPRKYNRTAVSFIIRHHFSYSPRSYGDNTNIIGIIIYPIIINIH